MSIEIVLIPLAIAAVSAWQAGRPGADQTHPNVVAVGTRMKNQDLLQRALADTGASVGVDEHGIYANWPAAQARFTRDDQSIWTAHFFGNPDLDAATGFVLALDTAYGRRVQQEVLARLKQRAPDAGMNVASETVEEDNSVTLVLNVNAGA